MSLKCGILGKPNVGKSSLLNALSQLIVADVANYPFRTINPNHSVVSVPDKRLEALREIVNSESVVPTTIEFVDIAGLVKNASQGEGLGNQFLTDIRTVNALIHVVRCFENPEIIHVDGKIDPLSDMDVINTELILSDLSLLERLQKGYQRTAKSGDKGSETALELLSKVEKELNNGVLLHQVVWEDEVVACLKKWEFLTIKPVIYLANVTEDGFSNNALVNSVQAQAKRENTPVVVSCVKLEADLIGTVEEEKKDLLALLGEEIPGLSKLIRAAYQLLGLQTFFTAGPKEVRAWTTSIGSTAWEAAGRIHTDFQRGFIAAEVVSYEDFIYYRGVRGAKAAGRWRIERRDYTVKDGDIILFRFNV